MVDLVNGSSKRLGGKLTFLLGALRGTLKYSNQPMRIVIDQGTDQERSFDGRFYNGVIANARYFGGGMMIAPDASMVDGLFDVVLLRDLSKLQVLSRTGSLYSGDHTSYQEVEVHRGRTVHAEALGDESVLIDVDGEQGGVLPAHYSLREGVLRLCRGPKDGGR